MYAVELKRGQEYEDLKYTITINILNFKLFDCDEPCSSFKLLETARQEVLTDKCSILFFELTKANKKVDSNDRKKLWLQLINAETKEELDILNRTGVSEIQKAVVILHEISLDEKVQEMARLREKWISDNNSALGNAKRAGIKEGVEKERKEVIEKMKKWCD